MHLRTLSMACVYVCVCVPFQLSLSPSSPPSHSLSSPGLPPVFPLFSLCLCLPPPSPSSPPLLPPSSRYFSQGDTLRYRAVELLCQADQPNMDARDRESLIAAALERLLHACRFSPSHHSIAVIEDVCIVLRRHGAYVATEGRRGEGRRGEERRRMKGPVPCVCCCMLYGVLCTVCCVLRVLCGV